VLNKEFDRFSIDVVGPFQFDLVQRLPGIAASEFHWSLNQHQAAQ